MAMASLNKELVFLLLQFLDEEKFQGTVHSLEKDSGIFFNVKYFEDCVTNGEWNQVEKYLSGFTKVEDNRYSMKILFEIRKLKYLEALDKKDKSEAVDILMKDLKVFSTINQTVFKELVLLLSLRNFRENVQLSEYKDAKSTRVKMLNELKNWIQSNPLFRDKLQFPEFKNSRLRILINQSLNWQHQLCQSPKLNPEIKSLFFNHTCGQPNVALAPSSVTNPSCVPHQAVSVGSTGISAPNNAAYSEHVRKRPRPFGLYDEVKNLPNNIFPITCSGQNLAPTLCSSDDLPKTVVANLNQGSAVKSMDFNPLHPTILLVGTNIGDIAIWDIGSREMVVLRTFKIWEIGKCSMILQATLANENTASVNKVIWSPDGALFGVAFSKHMVQIYSYHSGEDLQNHLEFDAHIGNVSDIAFANWDKKLCIVTCGEDKTIKVWYAADGTKRHTFEGHGAPVSSVCPNTVQNIPFIFSTSVDGEIKLWLYDNLGSRVSYDAPGLASSIMAYSADKTRLFSCGITKEGESLIVEWNDIEGTMKRTYHGLGKRFVEGVQFDTSKRFLAVGDEFAIKIWDMDNANVFRTIDAEGGLPASPSIRFSKEGMLLAVSTNENGVKVLANTHGTRHIRSIESRMLDTASRITPGSVSKDEEGRILPEMRPIITDQLGKSKICKLSELEEPSQLHSLRLPENFVSARVSRLIYTNSGGAILALACNAVHKLWKWQRNDRNVAGKANINISPQLYQPYSGILMTNDTSQTNIEEAVPCFDLSKNDSYVISASGGKISLFNIKTFKTMTTFMAPPPAATFIAFHPEDNNIIAIGMEDSSVKIYDVRLDEVKSELRGHQKRVTGLAFSNVINVLVSSGADAQFCVWSMDGWDKKTSDFLQIPLGCNPATLAQTRVQFHQDQVHLLVVHETQLALYWAPKLVRIKQWVPPDSSSITDATFSCDSRSIYASFDNGSVRVFIAPTLIPKCRISPTAYLPPSLSSMVQPLVIAANPVEPNQFALGLSDGKVLVLEPLEEGRWGYGATP